ncbi:hypothetical protein [Kribbella sp. C-35]|uniref:hypothetical protein n=1 Tax=Kribbella sp. C-35 TaxID=2789276 RepID=UPI00397A7201
MTPTADSRRWLIDKRNSAAERRASVVRSSCGRRAVLVDLQINPDHTVTESSDRGVKTRDADRRRRVTQPLRDEVIRRYASENETALEVAEECNMSESTALRILKTASVPMRRQGEKRL